MAESPTEELRMLRQRAYGPAADIHDDPAALARLRELEDRAARPLAPVASPAPAAGADAEIDARSASRAEAHPPDAGAHDADVDTTAVDPVEAFGAGAHAADGDRSRRTRVRWLWAASLVVALVAGAGIGVAVTSSGPGRVAVLADMPTDEVPTMFFGEPGDGAVAFEDFYGLSTMLIPNAMGTMGGETTCLIVMQGVTDDGTFDATGGVAGSGCGAGRFDAEATLRVTDAMSEEMRERYPVGTALQFVLKGSEVFVYADTSAAPPPVDDREEP